MSKKHKKHGKGSMFIPDTDRKDYKREPKKDKKNKGLELDKKSMRHSQSTLSDKEIRINRELMAIPASVPEKLAENRSKCNHSGKLLTLKEYSERRYSVFMIPHLDAMRAFFGEENLRVCADCGELVVTSSKISTQDVYVALMTLYAATNSVLATSGATDSKSLKLTNSIKEMVDDQGMKLLKIMTYLEHEAKKATNGPSVASDDDDVSSLNGVTTFAK